MEVAGEATTARDAGAVQRQRDRNIKKRDEQRAKRLTSEKAKKTRLAEARVRSGCSRVLTLTILPLTQSLCWRVRHARKLCSRANSPPTAAGRRPSAASVRVAPATPRLGCHASNAHDPTHRVFAAEKRNGRIQQKEAARARKGLAEDEHAAPKAQCALHPSLETHPPTTLPTLSGPGTSSLTSSCSSRSSMHSTGTGAALCRCPTSERPSSSSRTACDALTAIILQISSRCAPASCPCLRPPRFHPKSAVGATHRTLRCARAAAPSSDGTGVAAPGRSRVPAPDEGRLPIRQPGRPRGFPELDLWRPNFKGVGLAASH